MNESILTRSFKNYSKEIFQSDLLCSNWSIDTNVSADIIESGFIHSNLRI